MKEESSKWKWKWEHEVSFVGTRSFVHIVGVKRLLQTKIEGIQSQTAQEHIDSDICLR
jgi:hypothetical protein